LSLAVLLDKQHAALACMMFIFSPASVFYAVPYTESLYAALAFWGMVFWVQKDGGMLGNACAALLFAVATLTRSNGELLRCSWILWRVCIHAQLYTTCE
jgi:Gpi18-like mannosyltransferase